MSAEALFLRATPRCSRSPSLERFAARKPFAGPLVYGGSLAISAAMLVVALVELLGRANGEALVLPLGLPWIGARFRVDALSAFFLVVVNLGAAAASLYGLGYGADTSMRRSGCCRSSRPFSPA